MWVTISIYLTVVGWAYAIGSLLAPYAGYQHLLPKLTNPAHLLAAARAGDVALVAAAGAPVLALALRLMGGGE